MPKPKNIYLGAAVVEAVLFGYTLFGPGGRVQNGLIFIFGTFIIFVGAYFAAHEGDHRLSAIGKMVAAIHALLQQREAPNASITFAIDSKVPVLLVRNNGAAADFAAKLKIKGPLAQPFWQSASLHCRWDNTVGAWLAIPKGDMGRIVLADLYETRGVGGLTSHSAIWRIAAVAAQGPVEIESLVFGDPLTNNEVADSDVLLEVAVVGKPDLATGIQNFLIRLNEHGAACEQISKPDPAHEPMVFFQWEASTLPARSGGVFGAYGLIQGGDGVGSVASRWGHDHALSWPKNGDLPLTAIKCEVTNYGALPLANVLLWFPVVFRSAQGKGADGVVASGKWPIEIPKIDPGVANKVVFYLYNTNPVFITVDAPSAAAIELLNDRTRREVSLPEQSRFRQRVLFPVSVTPSTPRTSTSAPQSAS